MRSMVGNLLTWSEQYTKTDMRYLTKGGFWLFFGQGMVMLSSLALAVAFANLIEPELYGNYKYVLSLAGVISVLTLSGLTTAVTRGSARGYSGTLPYAFKTSLMWSVGMLLVAGIGATYYFYQENIFLGTSLLIIGATAPLITATSLYRPYLMGTQQFRRASLFGIIQALVPTIAVLTGLFFNLPLIVLVALYFGTTTLVLLLLYYSTRKEITETEPDPATGHIGKHLSIMNISSTAAGRIDSILIFQLLGGTELAIFTLATSVPDIIKGAMKNLNTLAMPKFAQKEAKELRAGVLRKIFLLTIFMAGIAGAYILAAPYLFTYLFPQYLSAIPYSQVYALILPTALILSGAYFDSQAAVKERYILNIVNTVSGITLAVLGILFFGLWGAIIGRLIGRVINVSLSLFFISRV